MKNHHTYISNVYKCITVFGLLVLIVCCEDSINLDLPLGSERVVITGWITNLEESYSVSVSRTVGFNDQTTKPGISGAEVYVVDRFSNRYDFVEAG